MQDFLAESHKIDIRRKVAEHLPHNNYTIDNVTS